MWGKGRFWGSGVKGHVRDWLGVIAQVAATECPPFNVAGFCRAFAVANPNRLRIDPCEKKSKRRELRRVAPSSVGGRENWSHWHGDSIATFFSGNAAAKFAKRFGFG